MEFFRNIVLIGTSHISKDSVSSIKKTYGELKPDIVTIELDPGRAYTLKHETKRPKSLDLIRQIGITGFLFLVFGEYIQKSLGKVVNLDPGKDMLTALELAEKDEKKIFLVDRDIQITLRRFSKHFRKREVLNMIADIVKGIFKKDELSKTDLSKVPSGKFIEYLIGYVKKRYPSLYRVLIHERDIYMSKQLFAISIQYPSEKIMSVVGAGHIPGMMETLDKMEKQWLSKV